MRFLVFLALAFASAAQADSIERFKTFLRASQSARADFEQKVYGRGGKLTQEARGTFVFQRPGKFRWTYAKPVDQLIVGDGQRVWIYDRDLNQVTVRRLSKALGSTPAALLAGSRLRSPRRCGRRRSTKWWASSTRRPGQAAAPRVRVGQTALDDPVGAARLGQDHARAADGEDLRCGVHRPVGGVLGRQGHPRG